MVLWNQHLRKEVNWIGSFTTLFFDLGNNNRIIQFYFKLWHRVSTCRYMRHKMKIEPDPYCCFCKCKDNSLETLFLNCKHTADFLIKVSSFISSNVENNYSDGDHIYLLTLSHANKGVNFINSVAAWFISRRAQLGEELNYERYLGEIKRSLAGAKAAVVDQLRETLSL